MSKFFEGLKSVNSYIFPSIPSAGNHVRSYPYSFHIGLMIFLQNSLIALPHLSPCFNSRKGLAAAL